MSGVVTPFPTCQHVLYREILFSEGTLFLYYLKVSRCRHVPNFQPTKIVHIFHIRNFVKSNCFKKFPVAMCKYPTVISIQPKAK